MPVITLDFLPNLVRRGTVYPGPIGDLILQRLVGRGTEHVFQVKVFTKLMQGDRFKPFVRGGVQIDSRLAVDIDRLLVAPGKISGGFRPPLLALLLRCCLSGEDIQVLRWS